MIAEIQDILIQNRCKVIVLFGDEGIGKTTLCHSLTSTKIKTVCFKIPSEREELFDPIDFLEEEIIKTFGCGLTECDLSHPYVLILIDQMENLSKEQLQRLFEKIFQCVHLRFICTSKEPFNELMHENDEGLLFHFTVPPLSQEEGKLLIQKKKPGYSLEEVHLTYLISCGNPLRIEKLTCMDIDFRNIAFEE